MDLYIEKLIENIKRNKNDKINLIMDGGALW